MPSCAARYRLRPLNAATATTSSVGTPATTAQLEAGSQSMGAQLHAAIERLQVPLDEGNAGVVRALERLDAIG